MPKKSPSSSGSGSSSSTPATGPIVPCPHAVCHAVLTIRELAFADHHPVEKDTLGNFSPPEWLDTRGAADQFPVCYTRDKKIRLTAKFAVTTQPSSSETVEVRGTATFGTATLRWTGTTTVAPGTTEVTVSGMLSDNPLPNIVECYESSPITWEMNPASTGWSPAGTTQNVVYATLADPTGTPVYWTLLEISCKGARNATSEAMLVSGAWSPFTTRSLNRKRDGHALTYWNPDTTRATNTRRLLAAADGSGQCGSWAEILIDMFKVHGITSADKIEIIRSQAARSDIGFLVKNWRFNHPPASSATSFTHVMGTECVELPGIPGQNNPNPPPAFFNHFIVRHGGRFYDPSYGAGPFADQVSWEAAAIDGLFEDSTGRAGHDKSLNASNKLLEFWNLSTGTRIP